MPQLGSQTRARVTTSCPPCSQEALWGPGRTGGTGCFIRFQREKHLSLCYTLPQKLRNPPRFVGQKCTVEGVTSAVSESSLLCIPGSGSGPQQGRPFIEEAAFCCLTSSTVRCLELRLTGIGSLKSLHVPKLCVCERECVLVCMCTYPCVCTYVCVFQLSLLIHPSINSLSSIYNPSFANSFLVLVTKNYVRESFVPMAPLCSMEKAG